MHSVRFESLGNMFLIQLKSIHSKYKESCTTIYQLFENPMFQMLYLILYKNQQFVIYIEKYVLCKGQKRDRSVNIKLLS